MQMDDSGAWVASARLGTSPAEPNQHPDQIGWSTSPCSNSIHTPVPIWGIDQNPICLPVTGKHGIAQLEVSSLSTSGTCTRSRPTCIGSMLLSTVPRYLPKYCRSLTP